MVNGALVNHMAQVRTSFPITIIFSLSLLLLLLCLLGSTGTVVMRNQLLVKRGAYAFRGSKGGEAIRDCEPLTDTIGSLDFNRFIGWADSLSLPPLDSGVTKWPTEREQLVGPHRISQVHVQPRSLFDFSIALPLPFSFSFSLRKDSSIVRRSSLAFFALSFAFCLTNLSSAMRTSSSGFDGMATGRSLSRCERAMGGRSYVVTPDMMVLGRD